MESNQFIVQHNAHGALTRLCAVNDPVQMNWVVCPDYLKQVGYQDDDKLFGEFDLECNGRAVRSIDHANRIYTDETQLRVEYAFDGLQVDLSYQLQNDGLVWRINLRNTTDCALTINKFSVWASLAYIMFRDSNVQRNASQSAAVFPSISKNYTKLAAVRRDNNAPHLGIFQTRGTLLSVGTFNRFTNLFFENISPSLDGILFHKLVLADDNPKEKKPGGDWIYPAGVITLAANADCGWSFTLATFNDRADFYTVASRLGHAKMSYQPMVPQGKTQRISIIPAAQKTIKSIRISYCSSGKIVTNDITQTLHGYDLIFTPQTFGEHKVDVLFEDGREDMLVFNAMPDIKEVLHSRLEHLSTISWSGAESKVPYSFRPLSVQGESLGKMNFILQTLLMDREVENSASKVQQVEQSAVHYVRNKWFIDGDFTRPRELYGDFYRVLDFDYISHLFFLLSQFPDRVLRLHTASTYLRWAADVLNLRCNPALHTDERGKSEAEIPGVAFLYINELLAALKQHGMVDKFQDISEVWGRTIDKIERESDTLTAAITEHFYDNAGFGPAAGALALADKHMASGRYANLLQANIGFSNDFRAQNPDRWWEALSYMIHSLWGGLPTAAAVTCGVKLNRPALVEAAWRATAGLFYLYDWNASSTARQLAAGEAASTYSVAGPNINRPDLSRNRFGQSIFASDGGIFAQIFTEGYTGEDDWDCGEELVAYLTRFGQATYLYQEQSRLHVVNGDIQPLDGTRMRIVSYAPYIREYVMISTGKTFTSSSTHVIYDAGRDVFYEEPVAHRL